VKLSAVEIRQAVRAALAEDIGSGDVTTLATVPETATARAVMQARGPLVVAGLDFAEISFREVFQFLDRRGERRGPQKSQPKSGRRGIPPSEAGVWLTPAQMNRLAFTSAHKKLVSATANCILSYR